MIISFSQVYCWQTCKREFYYKYGLGLTPANESNAIAIGVYGHKLLETFYKALQKGATKEEARIAIQSHKLNYETLEMVNAWVLVDNYIRALDLKGSIVQVERAFILPTAMDLTIGFTPDLIWDYKDKRLEAEDYKFIGRQWPNNKLARYSQLNLYTTFLERLGYDVKLGTLRFFNVKTMKISKKEYTPSRIVKDRLYEEFIVAALEAAEFLSLPVAEQKDIAIRTINYTVCQWCKFNFPCTLELEGKDASKTFAAEYVENTYGYTE